MRAVKISELPAYVLARLAGKLPTCVRPTSTNPADEDAQGCLPMCGKRAAYVAVTTPGTPTGVTWCADCVARDTSGWSASWAPLAVDDVEEFVDALAAPADPIADLTAERDRARADADRLAVERDQLTELALVAGRERDAAVAEAARLIDAAVAEAARLIVERDTARRQRDELTEQLDAALDDRDRARAELAVEVEAHRLTTARAVDPRPLPAPATLPSGSDTARV